MASPSTTFGIHDVHGVILKLDSKGRLKPEHRKHMMRSAGERLGAYLKNLPRSGRGTILPVGHIFVRRRQEASEGLTGHLLWPRLAMSGRSWQVARGSE